MRVLCPSCRAPITIPDARAGNPAMKVKCRCATVFALGDAQAAPAEASLGMAPEGLVTNRPRPAAPRTPAAAGEQAPPPRSPRPAVQARPATPAGARLPSRPAPAPPPAWSACGAHPGAASKFVCPRCVVGYCVECAHVVANAAVCGACDGLCVPVEQFGTRVQVGDDRSRPMMADLGTIATYPFRDTLAFVLLGLFTWFFSLLKMGGGFAILLSQGVLVWYGFSALSKVALGNLNTVMPEFTDIGDIARPLRLGGAALVMGYLPLFLCLFFLPGVPSVDFVDAGTDAAVVHAQEPEETVEEEAVAEDDAEAAGAAAWDGEQDYEEPKAGVLTFVLIGLAFLWKLAYTPVALTVAALSRSVLSTINPLIGISTITSMGTVYWQAAGIYTVIAVVQWAIGLGLDVVPVPVVPGILKAFVDAYAWLAIGCTLGLAVYKKAPELGWD